jgi:hypothetical protein
MQKYPPASRIVILRSIVMLISILFMSPEVGFAYKNQLFITEKHTEPVVLEITATKSSVLVKWYMEQPREVLVVASEQRSTVLEVFPEENYSAGNFGVGSKIGNGFVVYKGNGNSVHVRGLLKGRKYFFTIYSLTPEGLYLSDESLVSFSGNTKVSPNPPSQINTIVTCVCPPIAGVTCTLSGSTNTGTSVASQATCPHVGYCDGPGTNNSWTGSVSTGTLQYMFSAPVSSSTLRSNSVNDVDYATISAAGGSGGALSISGVTCMGVSGLVIGPLTNFTAGNDYGGVSWTVNSTGSYTVVTLTNTGASSGWVSACPTAITSVLPIELLSLNGNCVGKEIKITWQTLTERNNSYFTIERSYDTKEWSAIGNVPGAGNSSKKLEYHFTDVSPLNALAYYRLKQTDLDGKFKYSELITVKNCNMTVNVNIYPNPASTEIFITSTEDAELEVFNILGRRVMSKTILKGNSSISTDALSNGTYYFKVTDVRSESSFIKVILNK